MSLLPLSPSSNSVPKSCPLYPCCSTATAWLGPGHLPSGLDNHPITSLTPSSSAGVTPPDLPKTRTSYFIVSNTWIRW